METQKEALGRRLDSLVELYGIRREMIGSLRELSCFTSVCTAHEIRHINLIDRAIPGKIAEILEFKDSDSVRNIRTEEEFNRAWEKSKEFELGLRAVDSLLEEMQSRIPKHQTSLLSVVMHPLDFIADCIFEIWHRIIIAKLNIEGRILDIRKKRFISKKIALKIKLSPEEEDFLKHA